MKKKLLTFSNRLLVVLVTILSLPQWAAAYDFMVNGLCYNKNSDGTSVYVTCSTSSFLSSGNYSTLSGAISIPASVTYSGTTYSVTCIGYGAFFNCSGLTSVTIPNSVTSIDANAFSDCSSLTSMTVPNSVTSIGSFAFFNCSGLTSVTIPNSVTSIDSNAFENCSGLTSVTIPNSVTSIGNHAFQNCSGLKRIVVESGNATYDSRNNCNALIETASNTLISGCKNSTIPNSVTSIGGSAFSGCSGLTSLTIPNSVTSIGNSAFYNCSGLTSVTIPNSVTSIGNFAFSYCTGLTSVTIPNSVTSIGNFAFSYCTGLTSVTIPNAITSINDYSFRGCTGLTSVTIPNSVTSIGNYAFRDCSGLTSVTIPNSVTSIGNSAFYYCSGLTSVTIPDSVTNIGHQAFSYCSELTSVTIPNSVTSIGNFAFSYCIGLKMIHSKIENPSIVQLGSSLFDNVPKSTCVLVVPAASIDRYQSTSPWNEFTNIKVDTMTSLNMIEQTLELMKRKTHSVEVNFEPSNAWNNFVWTSSDNSVATVDENGVVTGVSLGTAVITATYSFNTNLCDSSVVTVFPNCDVNDDDWVDITDINLVINKMLGKNGAPAIELADINEDGEVDIFDINEVIGYMLGK